jgi:hypothetical protein
MKVEDAKKLTVKILKKCGSGVDLFEKKMCKLELEVAKKVVG